MFTVGPKVMHQIDKKVSSYGHYKKLLKFKV